MLEICKKTDYLVPDYHLVKKHFGFTINLIILYEVSTKYKNAVKCYEIENKRKLGLISVNLWNKHGCHPTDS